MIALIMRLTGLSRGFSIAVLVVAAIVGLAVAKAAYDHTVIARHEAKVAAQVAKAVAAGNEAAGVAVEAKRTQVEQTNETARQAASGSDDPLRAGLDSLRARTPKDRPAAR